MQNDQCSSSRASLAVTSLTHVTVLHSACYSALLAVTCLTHVIVTVQDLRALSKRVQFRGQRQTSADAKAASDSSQPRRHLLADQDIDQSLSATEADMTQTQQEPRVDEQDLQQQQVQQLEAGVAAEQQQQQQQQQSPAAKQAGQESGQQESAGQQSTDAQIQSTAEQQQQQQQASQQQQESQQQQQQQSQQQQQGLQQRGTALGAGLVSAGLTVEQAADKTQEHAMAAMMGGPPQWGGRFDNR